jgi:hypothetical protein
LISCVYRNTKAAICEYVAYNASFAMITTPSNIEWLAQANFPAFLAHPIGFYIASGGSPFLGRPGPPGGVLAKLAEFDAKTPKLG